MFTNYVYNQYRTRARPSHLSFGAVLQNSAGYGIYIPSTRYPIFNIGTSLTDMAGFTVDTVAPEFHDRLLLLQRHAQGHPRRYTSVAGRPQLPPKWAFGLWMSANEWNTQTEVNNERTTPAPTVSRTVLVLEQWADEATFYIWHGSTYTAKLGSQKFAYTDFTFPGGGEWSDPKAMAPPTHIVAAIR